MVDSIDKIKRINQEWSDWAENKANYLNDHDEFTRKVEELFIKGDSINEKLKDFIPKIELIGYQLYIYKIIHYEGRLEAVKKEIETRDTSLDGMGIGKKKKPYNVGVSDIVY